MRRLGTGFFASLGGAVTLRPTKPPIAGVERRVATAGILRGAAAAADRAGEVAASGVPTVASGASVAAATLGAGAGSVARVAAAALAAGTFSGASAPERAGF